MAQLPDNTRRMKWEQLVSEKSTFISEVNAFNATKLTTPPKQPIYTLRACAGVVSSKQCAGATAPDGEAGASHAVAAERDPGEGPPPAQARPLLLAAPAIVDWLWTQL